MSERSIAEHGTRVDYEDECAGTANIFMITEPLAAWREVKVRQTKMNTDWATEMARSFGFGTRTARRLSSSATISTRTRKVDSIRRSNRAEPDYWFAVLSFAMHLSTAAGSTSLKMNPAR
jgi:hypothetical protein